jgi:hypothetical protein
MAMASVFGRGDLLQVAAQAGRDAVGGIEFLGRQCLNEEPVDKAEV